MILGPWVGDTWYSEYPGTFTVPAKSKVSLTAYMYQLLHFLYAWSRMRFTKSDPATAESVGAETVVCSSEAVDSALGEVCM